MMQRLNARNAMSLLAAAVALTACGGGDTGNTSAPAPTQIAAATCATPPQLFTNTVWPSMSSTCVVCHRTGAVASGTRLVFAAGGSAEVNYGVLRTFAAANGDLLLSKSIGLPTHTGGKVFGDANSQQYKDLAALLPKLKESCNSEVIATGEFYKGVKFADDVTMLGKASVLFAGRTPTATETAAVAGGGDAVLRQTIRNYMQGPSFDNFLTEAGQVQYLVNGVVIFGNDRGLDDADFPLAADVINNNNPPAGVRARFETTMRFEPINLQNFIVKNDRSWKEIVSARYTVLNGVTAPLLGAQVQGTFMNPDDDTELLPAVIPNARLGGNREHAGVLASHAYLDRFATTPTNRNRHRVSETMKRFAATYIPLLASRPLSDGQFRVTVMDNPGCAVCHDVMDPIAAGFQNWPMNNRFRPNGAAGMAHALDNVYMSTNYMNDAKGNEFYRPNDNWYRDGKAPGYGTTEMPNGYNNPKAAEWLGDQIAADPRFAVGAVHYWHKALFHREPLHAPTDTTAPDAAARLAAYNAQEAEFKEIAARFAANGYKVKDLLVDLMLSKEARAVSLTEQVSAQRAASLVAIGKGHLLSTSRLQRKFVGVLGLPYAGFNNPFAGPGLAYGGFDANTAKNPQVDFTTNQVTTLDVALLTMSCQWTAADFAKAPAARLLFPLVTMTDTPATQAGKDKILANIVHLHDKLWNERVTTTDADVQRTYQLFEAVYNDRATASARPTTCQLNATNDPGYVARSWAALVMYMAGSQEFLTF